MTQRCLGTSYIRADFVWCRDVLRIHPITWLRPAGRIQCRLGSKTGYPNGYFDSLEKSKSFDARILRIAAPTALISHLGLEEVGMRGRSARLTWKVRVD